MSKRVDSQKNGVSVLLIGANFLNKGAEAMLLTVKQQLSTRIPVVKIYMICKYYEKSLSIDAGIEPIYIPSWIFIIRGQFLKVYKKIRRIVSKQKLPYFEIYPFMGIKKRIKELDAIVDISGYAYGGKWGSIIIKKVLKLKSIYPNAKLFFLPQAWGPFEDEQQAKYLIQLLSKSNRFYSRDKVSQLALSELTKKPVSSIAIENDIVFLLEGLPRAKSKINSHLKSENEIWIGISPNMRIYEYFNGTELENQYIKLLSKICSYILEKEGTKIVFIPNEIKPMSYGYSDDRFLCKLLYQNMKDKERCIFIDGYQGAVEIRELIGELDLLIGSRFHALIFAFSQGIPCVGLSWSHKYRELFRVFGFENYVIERNEFDNDDKIIEIINEVMIEHQNIKRSIVKKSTEIKKSIDTVFEDMVLTIHDKSLK